MSSELPDMLIESLGRVLLDNCGAERVQAAESGGFDAQLWALLEELGFPLALVAEAQGGISASVDDLLAVVRLAARHAAPVPLAESALLAAWAAGESGLAFGDGVYSVVVQDGASPMKATRVGVGWRVDGTAVGVPAARFAQQLFVVAEAGVTPVMARVAVAELHLDSGNNLAGEARDSVVCDNVLVEADAAREMAADFPQRLYRLGALCRAVQMTGAMERTLELSVNYASERQQFGRPLAKFQAVQQQLAIAAAEVAACQAIIGMAARNLHGADAEVAVAAAKIRAGEAASLVARVAHQVHGAMGFTQEYPLHHLTRRLWSWRDEYGSEAQWAERLGKQVTQRRAVWPMITALK